MSKSEFDPKAVQHLLNRYGAAPEPEAKRRVAPFWESLISWLVRRIKWS